MVQRGKRNRAACLPSMRSLASKIGRRGSDASAEAEHAHPDPVENPGPSPRREAASRVAASGAECLNRHIGALSVHG